MIPNQWYAILESNEVKRGKPIGVTRMGEKLVMWRDEQGKVVCMRDLCPHRGAALSIGKLMDGHIQCPFHGFQYDSSGQCLLIPANGATAPVPKVFKAHTYLAREEHDFIWIWWGEAQPEAALPPIKWFNSIDASFVYATFKDHWASHYSRAIENQLDVVHLPFVHYNTIGAGNRTVVDGPICRWENDNEASGLLNLWVYNRVEDGQPGLRANQLPEPQRRPFLQFAFPNVWQNWISDTVRIVIAFVPINDENTMMYIRYYQKAMKIPGLRELFNWVGLLSSFIIERQDRRVVITQRPKRPFLQMGEKLIQGDGPVITYRRHREALIKAASKD
jgi:phenylpropionate dioxygenase-like ring-hydroxylating dioxygenase large terminal subunit